MTALIKINMMFIKETVNFNEGLWKSVSIQSIQNAITLLFSIGNGKLSINGFILKYQHLVPLVIISFSVPLSSNLV